MHGDAPETPLDSDEPNTPGWFTALGVGLFLFGGIFLLATDGDEEEAAAAAKDAPAANADAPADPAGKPTDAPSGAPQKPAAADPHAGHDHPH